MLTRADTMQLRLEERQREACQKAAVALYFDLVTRLTRREIDVCTVKHSTPFSRKTPQRLTKGCRYTRSLAHPHEEVS